VSRLTDHSKTPTPAQSMALTQAERRSEGEPWQGDTEAAEECCDLGWLEAPLRTGARPGEPNSTVYVLTEAGRAVIRGKLPRE